MKNQRLHHYCGAAGAHTGAGVGGAFALAGTERQYERSRPFVITHLAADLELDFERAEVRGKVRLDFERRSPIDDCFVLDAIAFQIASLTLVQGRRRSEPEYTYDSAQIAVGLPRNLGRGSLEIEYRARPQRGMYFLKPDAEVPERPEQVWTQCQDEDARHFLPCQDKPHVKMTTDLKASVPAGFTVLSNGRLVSSSTKAASKRWKYHFSMPEPHPSYLITLVAGRFSVLDDAVTLADRRKIPLSYYVPVGREADARRTFKDTPQMLRLFSKLTGVSYPWESYAQVVVSDFVFGGMENTTATTLYEHVLYDQRAALDISSNDLIAHELAHQWFGDLVTCRDWSHAWLNEGFATFFEHLEREDRLGRSEYDYGIVSDLETYLGEAQSRYKRPIVCRDYSEPLDLFDRHLYEKGGLVLHLLRRDLGDDTFWQGVHRYLKSFAGKVVETNDLQRALEEVSGRSLERFFDQWVYRPGHPELKLKIAYADGLVSVGVTQEQRGTDVATFQFLLEVELETAQGKLERHKKPITRRNDTLVIRQDKRPRWVAFDPDLKVLGRVTLSAPEDMLRQQLSRAPLMRERMAAASALADHPNMLSLEALAACLKKGKEEWMVRAQAARSLGQIAGDDALTALLGALTTEHPKVRRAAAEALGKFRDARVISALSRCCRTDNSYLVAAAAARALGRSKASEASDVLKQMLERSSWAEVLRSAALSGLASLDDQEHLAVLLEWSRYGRPTRARRAAIAGIAKLAEGKRALVPLEELLRDKHPHLRADVVSALGELDTPKADQALRRHLAGETDARVRRRAREVLDQRRRRKGTDKQLADEVEKLQSEISGLRMRLAKLEHKRMPAGPDGTAKGRSAGTSRKQSAGKAKPARKKKAR